MAQDEFLQLVSICVRARAETSATRNWKWPLARGRELQRLLFQAQVDSRGSGPAAEPVCGADGYCAKLNVCMNVGS